MNHYRALFLTLFLFTLPPLARGEEPATPVEPAAATEPKAETDALAPEPVTFAPAPMGVTRRPSWGFNTALGFGGTGGDFGDLLKKPVAGDFGIFRDHGKWRFGLGLSFTSFKMKEPFQDEPEWGFQQTYLSATRMFRQEGTFLPYLQLRGGFARLH